MRFVGDPATCVRLCARVCICRDRVSDQLDANGDCDEMLMVFDCDLGFRCLYDFVIVIAVLLPCQP